MQEKAFIKQVSPVEYRVEMGFVPNMRVPGTFYVNSRLKDLIFEELQQHVHRGEVSEKAQLALHGMQAGEHASPAALGWQRESTLRKALSGRGGRAAGRAVS